MDWAFVGYLAVGFLAQLVDGALGMAYGVTSTSFLLGLGVPPAAASAGVHVAKITTTCASGLSHLALRNVDRVLFQRLALPGAIGAAVGALTVSHIPADVVQPILAVYLLAMGWRLMSRALGRPASHLRMQGVGRLGLLGGFCDAMGGGGWGPVVAGTLLGRDIEPRKAIGSVNLAEFFVAVAASVVFAASLHLSHGRLVLGLTLGGLAAAPLAAWGARKLPPRALLFMVGVVISLLSLRNLWLSLT
ncbi:MAG: sulfite exporter TauE/SafE family protein [Armatimonadetes bacterium]|nr:sulfite exporter TauE/SafE family protein [Armatimonadota bacterium]